MLVHARMCLDLPLDHGCIPKGVPAQRRFSTRPMGRRCLGRVADPTWPLGIAIRPASSGHALLSAGCRNKTVRSDWTPAMARGDIDSLGRFANALGRPCPSTCAHWPIAAGPLTHCHIRGLGSGRRVASTLQTRRARTQYLYYVKRRKYMTSALFEGETHGEPPRWRNGPRCGNGDSRTGAVRSPGEPGSASRG